MKHRSVQFSLAFVVVVGALATNVNAQAFDPSRDFQVDTTTTGNQHEPVVAADQSGGFSATWYTDSGTDLDGDGRAVFARRFDSLRRPSGLDFVVNSYTTDSQSDSSVACAPSPNCLFVWNSNGQDGSRSGVFGQIFNGEGDPVGGEFQINQFTTEFQGDARVAAFPNGFVVIWESGGDNDGDRSGIFGRSFGNRGAPLSDEVQVNAFTAGNQTVPSIAANSESGFLVAWQSREQDGSDYGVFAQLFDREGSAVGSEFQVNTYTTDAQEYPTIASSSTRYLVTWRSEQDGSETGVFGQFYDTGGAPIGDEFQVNTVTTGRQETVAVGSDGIEGFVVVWSSEGPFPSGKDIFGQRYDREGNRVRGEFAVNLNTEATQDVPSVAGLGSFVVVWESRIGDDDLLGITGRVFGDGGCVGDCDGDLRISISELVLGVSIALERNNLAHCEVLDESDDGTVGINELIQAVDNALRACVR